MVDREGTKVAGSESKLDVIGFGALNVDYIASATSLSRHMADHVSESAARFEGNVEGPATEAVVLGVIDQLGAASLEAALGGSAWNTIFALAQMRMGVKLGYVGVLGQLGMLGLSFTHQMDLFQIDRTWVARRPSRPCGMCLSYIDDGERNLLTCPGANLDMCEYLRDNGEDIARYLASAHIVHTTSFLDPDTPVEQLAVLRKAKELNRGLRISFDPGHDWAVNPTEAVLGILRLADYIFVNFREFKALGRYVHGQPDLDVARNLLSRCGPNATVFVTKRYDFIEMFRSGSDSVMADRFRLSLPANVEQTLEDATGAGDVFSAAVIAALASRELHLELGSLVGLSLARHKLTQSALPSLSDGFLQISENLVRRASNPTGVFISHDGNPQWLELRDFVQGDCRLPVYDLDMSDPEIDVAQAVRDVLGRCGFAICLLSVDSETITGAGRADQDIVHQAGLFHGRYGFGRVALLVEDGCEVFSNAAGLVRLPFPRGRVDATFLEVERILIREGLLGRGGA